MQWSPCGRAGAAGGERGATAVEFALLFTFLFLPTCFATVSGGILFSDKLAITQGAREGARYGATLPYVASSRNNFMIEIRTAAQDATDGELGSGNPEYCVAFQQATGVSLTARRWVLLPGSSTAVNGTCPDGVGPGTGAHVLVTAAKRGVINLLLLRLEPAVGAISVARYEGES